MFERCCETQSMVVNSLVFSVSMHFMKKFISKEIERCALICSVLICVA